MLQDLNCSNIQGRAFNIDEDGVILRLGKETKNFILKAPNGTNKVYFTFGDPRLLDDSGANHATLKIKYPRFVDGQGIEFLNPSIQPDTIYLMTAAGETVTDMELIKL